MKWILSVSVCVGLPKNVRFSQLSSKLCFSDQQVQGLSLFSCVAISMVVQDFVDHGSWGKIHTRVYGTTLSQLAFYQALFRHNDIPRAAFPPQILHRRPWATLFCGLCRHEMSLCSLPGECRILEFRTRSRLPKFGTYDSLALTNFSLPHALKNQVRRPARYRGAFHLIVDASIRTHISSYLGYENRFHKIASIIVEHVYHLNVQGAT